MKKGSRIVTLALPIGAMLALAQPAAAADSAAAAAAAAGAAAATAEAAPAKRAEAKKYCLNIIPDTGSRTGKRACKTREEWSEQGVDVTAKK